VLVAKLIRKLKHTAATVRAGYSDVRLVRSFRTGEPCYHAEDDDEDDADEETPAGEIGQQVRAIAARTVAYAFAMVSFVI
jgi:hypothetical protein